MARRKCIVINKRSAIGLVMIFMVSGIRHSETAGGGIANQMNSTLTKNEQSKDLTSASISHSIDNIALPGRLMLNDTNTDCSNLNTQDIPCTSIPFACLSCAYNLSCHYGRDVNVTCEVPSNMACIGERQFQRTMNCRYCYQTELWQQKCKHRAHCNAALDKYYRTNCSVHADVACMGNRLFSRNLRCNWTQGYRWSTALIISLTLGGFGADRFYLGHWQEGIGKLFSFGGLGVWTIIDVLLISLHYLGPADGSLYI